MKLGSQCDFVVFDAQFLVFQDQEAGMAVLGMINEDYPQALHNELHHFLKEIVVSNHTLWLVSASHKT